LDGKLSELVRSNPVLSSVGAVLLIILGILMIIYPLLVAWGVGIGLILAGIAVLATVYSEGGRGRP
jgi:multidrug transporter EmrE-like cation transporter